MQTTLERKIPLVTIRSVGLSNLQDDWMALNTTSGEEGDPLISCVLKTEFLVHLQQCTNGGVQINIGPTVSYAKKNGKMSTITFRKDDSIPRGDVYKSSTVSVPSGMPPNSVSAAPVPRKSKPKKAPKQSAVVRPLMAYDHEEKPALTTLSHLQRAPGGRRPATQTLPGSNGRGVVPPAPAGIAHAPAAPTFKAAQPVAATASRAAPPPPSRAPAPPPPPPPAAAEPDVEKFKS